MPLGADLSPKVAFAVNMRDMFLNAYNCLKGANVTL